jgi:hypothetical protein
MHDVLGDMGDVAQECRVKQVTLHSLYLFGLLHLQSQASCVWLPSECSWLLWRCKP